VGQRDHVGSAAAIAHRTAMTRLDYDSTGELAPTSTKNAGITWEIGRCLRASLGGIIDRAGS